MIEEVRLELVSILNKMEILYIKLENLRNADNDIRNNIERLELLISDIEYEIEKSNPEGVEKQRNEFLEKVNNSWQKFQIDYSAIATEEQMKRLNDAMEEYNEYNDILLENGDEITATEIEFQKLRELYESKKLKYYSKYEGSCTHPLCYNIGYYAGKYGTLVAIEKASYSIDICLECCRELATYRKRRQKGNPNWYQPKYEVIEYKNGLAYTELRRNFRNIYIHSPEAIATEEIKEYIKSNSK